MQSTLQHFNHFIVDSLNGNSRSGWSSFQAFHTSSGMSGELAEIKKKAFTRRSFVVSTDNVPVISSRPCMVSATDKSAMQQRHSDVPFTEIWAAAGTMILPSYMFAEEKLFCGRIVRVPHLSVKIAKWMAWTGFFRLKIKFLLHIEAQTLILVSSGFLFLFLILLISVLSVPFFFFSTSLNFSELPEDKLWPFCTSLRECEYL